MLSLMVVVIVVGTLSSFAPNYPLFLTAVYIIPFIVTISAYTAILHTLFRQFYKLRNTESRQSQGEERGNHVSNRGLIPRARVKVSEVLHL